MSRSRVRIAPVIVAVAALALGAGCGSGGSGGSKTVAGPATTTLDSASPATTVAGQPKAAARWETVTTLSGSGATSSGPFTILSAAIQWRARWSCDSGALKVDTDPPPRRPAPLVDSPCPMQGEGFSIVTGPVKLAVQATGPWKMTIDQQVDTPLEEPPLAGMASAKVLGQGDFYRVEKDGSGTARIYQLPDGSRALRLENLIVNQNTDLFVWLDEAVSPKTSKEAVSATYYVLGNLKSTVGTQNYLIPANVPIDRIHSVVIWCQPVSLAYVAANLDK